MVGNPGSVFARRSTDGEEASRIGKAVLCFMFVMGFQGRIWAGGAWRSIVPMSSAATVTTPDSNVFVY